jgi:hypothetical protein
MDSQAWEGVKIEIKQQISIYPELLILKRLTYLNTFCYLENKIIVFLKLKYKK